MNIDKNITITDVANALGVSKTTVSRAISGHGRISQETRNNVLEYITKHGYVPNAIAKGLAQKKTYNICVTMPSDYNISELPFFQKVMLGICDVLSDREYDVLIAKVSEDEISNLERIVNNGKVDAVILTRTIVNGIATEYLKRRGIPFLVLGSCPDNEVVQIDAKNFEGSMELTSILLAKGFHNMCLLGGKSSFYVTKSRLDGYLAAFEKAKIDVSKNLIYENLTSELAIEKAVDDALNRKSDCIVCMDDDICTKVLSILKKEKIKIPRDIKIASFYGSNLLEFNVPAITCVNYSQEETGAMAAKTILDIIDKKENVIKKQSVGYNVVMKDSTQE